MKRLWLLVLAAGCASLGAPAPTYDALLADPEIGGSVVWDAPEGPVPYSLWTAAQKADLDRALAAREAGKPAGLRFAPGPGAGLPVTDDSSFLSISGEDAWKMYLAHIAHSLWLERHQKTRWRLREMSREHRALLLDSRKLIARQGPGFFRIARLLMGHAVSWDPSIAYRFLEENGMIRATPEKTVLALSQWANLNLRHIVGPMTYAELYGYDGPPPVDAILYPPKPGPRWVGGCWGVTGFYAGVLRGANIPVESSINGMHSRPIFPTANRAMAHGDDIYTATVGPSGNAVPPEKIVMTLEEFKRMTNPAELDCAEGKCNTAEEQADYNMRRRSWLLAREYLTDYPLAEVASGGAERLDRTLQGVDDKTKELLYAKPLFSAAERKEYLAAVKAELARIGEGDAEKGAAIARRRALSFYRLPKDRKTIE